MTRAADYAIRAVATIVEMTKDRGLDARPPDAELLRNAADNETSFGIAISSAVTAILHTEPAPLRKDQFTANVTGPSVGAKGPKWPPLVILVTMDHMAGSTHRSLVATAAANGSKLHHFTIAELQFNVTRHSLVPMHRVLPEPEVGDLMRRLRLSSKFALPAILSSDPVARYFGLEPGNVVSITRPSDSVGQGIAYRVCKASGHARSK